MDMNNELRGLLPSFGVTFCHIFATAAALYHPPPFHCYPFVVPQRRTIIPIGVASSYKGVGMSRDKRVESLKVRRSQATPVSLALLVLSAQGALADDAVQSKPAVLSEVVVSDMSIDPLGLDQKQRTGSRLDLTPRETPASVTVIDREVFEQRGAQNTQEILRGVPGITSSAAPGSPGALFYRGFSGGSVTQLFNGITVQYDVIAARPVDSWIYDRVEAVGGPSSFLYGAGAVGGSINYITKLANRDGNLTEAKARYGSYNDSQLAAGTNQKLGESNYVRIDVNGTKIDGWSDGTERKAWQAAASWLADLTPQLSSTVALEYQYENVDQPYWGTPVLRPFVGEIGIDNRTRFKNYNSQDGLYKQTVKWGRWILDYRVDDTLRFRNTLYHYDALRDYQNVETYTFNANNSRVVRSNALLQRHDQDLNGNRLEANWNSEIGGLPSNWVAGLDYSVNKQTRYPLSIAGPFGSVNPTNFVNGALLQSSRHDADLQSGSHQSGADAGAVCREPYFPDPATVVAYRAALGQHRSRSDQSPHADRDQSGVLRTTLQAPDRSRWLDLRSDPGCQCLCAIQHGSRSARRHPDHGFICSGSGFRPDDRPAG